MLKLKDIQQLDYKTRLKIAIILFIVISIIIITIFFFSMKSNINKFYIEVKNIPDNSIISDISSTIENSNQTKNNIENDNNIDINSNSNQADDLESIEVNIERNIKEIIEN